MTRAFLGAVVALGTTFCLVGCGDDAGLEDYSAPLKVVKRVEIYLTGLKDKKLPSPDFSPSNDLALSYSGELIRVVLPAAMAGGIKDASRKQQAADKCEQLKQIFDEQVDEPARASPPQIEKAVAGVEQCLTLTGELRDLLGG
jgi:hypothetical protein